MIVRDVFEMRLTGNLGHIDDYCSPSARLVFGVYSGAQFSSIKFRTDGLAEYNGFRLYYQAVLGKNVNFACITGLSGLQGVEYIDFVSLVSTCMLDPFGKCLPVGQ